MPELYVGTKFRTVFAARQAPEDPRIPQLLRWCRRFAALGLAPNGAGNLSFRSARGFIVTRTAGNLGSLTAGDLVEVLEANPSLARVIVQGAHEPSSESLMHAALYRSRPATMAVFHGHSGKLLREAQRLGLPMTARERPYGTPEVAAEVLELPGAPDLFIVRNHGFVSTGETIQRAGRRVEEILERLGAE